VGVGRGPGGPPHFAFVHPRQGVFDGANAANTSVRATPVAHAFLRAASPLLATHGSSKDSDRTAHYGRFRGTGVIASPV
jgi:hypothetical protein